jgi:hypothetical protein
VSSFRGSLQRTDNALSSLENEGFHLDREAVSSKAVWELLKDLSTTAKQNGMEIFSCAEEMNFTDVGIPPGRCIDGELINRLWSLNGHTKKDPSQRPACLCVVSKDIGLNNTCTYGCLYCYATSNFVIARRRCSEHDPGSPLLWSKNSRLRPMMI